MENWRNRSVNEKNETSKRSAGARRTVNSSVGSEMGRTHPERAVREELTDSERRRRLERKQKNERIRRRRLRAAAAVLCAAVITVIIVFMTPIFDIRQINVNGNNYVSIEMIQEKVGELVGENIFRTSVKDIENRMHSIPQIDKVSVTKHYFPASVTIDVKEASPAAYVLSGNKIVVISADLKVIDDSDVFDRDTLPSISGISVSSYELNSPLSTDSADKEEILRHILRALKNTGILGKVTYVSVDDLTDIQFNYDNRINVLCGSQLELERKARMFAEAINSETMKSNSIGTMDLSVPGRAVYTP